MSEYDVPTPPGFAAGATDFLFEEKGVRILGADGTEAFVPHEDFYAFLIRLAEDLAAEDGGLDEETE